MRSLNTVQSTTPKPESYNLEKFPLGAFFMSAFCNLKKSQGGADTWRADKFSGLGFSGLGFSLWLL